ncbi:hypothetical protein J1605_016925 [Eschrichtius robustus]|uniref:Uncharacterized protein n=1 Tax=Eschrichtius robustus TaxID=9764 RepID=A0AB34I0N2_ESCRO|nr:hypothetical protein J1605_016925 [Eschrichtius robustus]
MPVPLLFLFRDLSENQILGIPRKAFRGIADVKNLPQELKVLRVRKLKNYGQALLLHLDVRPKQQGSSGTGEESKLTA